MSDAALRLRPATPDDLDFIVAAEHANRRFVTAWPRERHAAALADPDIGQFVVEEAASARALGYALLVGLVDPQGPLEFRRLVIVEQGRGHGRAAVRLVKHLAFRELGRHRLWLDVVVGNDRARRLYESEGFVLEGRLRDAHWTGEGRVSLDVLSLLAPEYSDD